MNVKISYPTKTASALVLATALGAGLVGVNKISYGGSKDAAYMECGMDHKIEKPYTSRDVKIEHARIRNDIYRGNPLYYLELPGIELGMRQHNIESHSSKEIR